MLQVSFLADTGAAVVARTDPGGHRPLSFTGAAVVDLGFVCAEAYTSALARNGILASRPQVLHLPLLPAAEMGARSVAPHSHSNRI